MEIKLSELIDGLNINAPKTQDFADGYNACKRHLIRILSEKVNFKVTDDINID